MRFRSRVKWWALSICLLAAVVAAAAFHNRWPGAWPAAEHQDEPAATLADHGHDHADGEHADDGQRDHGEGKEPDDHDHDEAAALRLSKQAEANIELDLYEVKLRPFARTISVPATVVQRPGRSQVQITAPFTGLVTQIHRVEGEAVAPGMALFDVQLTHEELVEAQGEFLRIAEELDVVKREVERVAAVVAEGAIAGKSLLERQYEQQKLEAAIHAHRQRLLLHRLTSEQVQGILDNRKLLQHMTVTAPPAPEDSTDNGEPLMQVRELNVEKGQYVATGAPLCMLADYSRLYIQGKAFEQDISTLAAAAKQGWGLTAVFQDSRKGRNMVEDLKILYLANEVQEQSRAFYFYATLPNELVRDTKTEAGQRFIDWKFKPGQRLRLLVPVEPTIERIVLPAEAVVQDGAEAYVFERNGDHFDRRSVHVEHRDADRVVIANDGSLESGVEVALSGAYQIHLGTKNKAGQGVDPHAGHRH